MTKRTPPHEPSLPKHESVFMSNFGELCYSIATGDLNRPWHEEASHLPDNYLTLMDECKSPIERILGAALLFANDGYERIKYLFAPDTDGWDNVYRSYPEFGTVFYPQAPVGNYTADFMVVSCCNGVYRFTAIECDGHDFHERTKEQASRDKRRDRFFQARGIAVMRFTGTDIYRDTRACIDELEPFLCHRLEEAMHEAGVITIPQNARKHGS